MCARASVRAFVRAYLRACVPVVVGVGVNREQRPRGVPGRKDGVEKKVMGGGGGRRGRGGGDMAISVYQRATSPCRAGGAQSQSLLDI